jgi:hypothetical protein
MRQTQRDRPRTIMAKCHVSIDRSMAFRVWIFAEFSRFLPQSFANYISGWSADYRSD